MNDRYYHAGGGVREFCRSMDDLYKSTLISITAALYSSRDVLFSKGKINVDRIQRTFIAGASDSTQHDNLDKWTQLIDSEFVIRRLARAISLNDIWTICNWANHAGVLFIKACSFELYIHKVNLLKFELREYSARESENSNYEWLEMKHGKAVQGGETADYSDKLKKFWVNYRYTYWYPDDTKFSTINSIFKYVKQRSDTVESAATTAVGDSVSLVDARQANARVDYAASSDDSVTESIGIAYLLITTAKAQSIDLLKVEELSKVFAGKDMTPIFIALCPDRDRWELFRFENANVAAEVGTLCKLYTGYSHPSKSTVMEIDDTPTQIMHSYRTRM